MRVKTFRGENMAAVLAQIRQELGSEAVILGNQTVREEGRCLCEVMAALEHPMPAATESNAAKSGGNGSKPGNGSNGSKPGNGTNSSKPTISAPLAPSADWNREWGEIKGHLLALLRPRMDFGSLTPRQRLALEFMEREGVDESAILSIYGSIAERGEGTVIPALSRIVRVKPLTPDAWPRTAHMFIGPSGVGKTTTLLRLALAANKQIAGRVLVVNADGGRGKGRLLLRHYAELSGLSYAEVDGPDDFRRLLDRAASGGAVFVDTPSLRGEGAMDAWCNDMGLSGYDGLAAHLVMSPLFTPTQARHYLAVNRCEHLASLIWTKLDEACNYGSLVNMAHASSLPVSALAYGPELSQGMAPATGKAVWKLLFKHQLPGEYSDTDAGA
ncbi:MAG: flagellar biosynthesis protein FlhF [Solidesulfovibrio sp.]